MKKATKKKDIKSVGFCIIRPDLIKRGLSVPTGNMNCNLDDAMQYRWLGEEEGDFQVFVYGQWRDAESIDFEFLSAENKILQNIFKNYTYSNAMEEIKTWTATQLKEVLRHCKYKTYAKDIMIDMVQDLARIHVWKLTMTRINPFLNK